MRGFLAVLLSMGIGLCSGQTARGVASRQRKGNEKPTWAKRATVLDLSCAKHPSGVESPDHQSSVEVICNEHDNDDPTYVLRVMTGGNHIDLPLRSGAHELLWSPDSKWFFVNGGETSYSEFFLSVYQLEASSHVREISITELAQRDMVERFPPCKAENRDENDCRQTANNAEFNMSGLGWTDDSSAVLVFAEVPCSSSYGGVMCQVQGYELDATTGRILRSLTARQLKEQWSRYAAWKIKVPPAPIYGNAQIAR